MAYYLKVKSGKVHLYDTKANGALAIFGRNVKDVDIQGNEVVVYKDNDKIETYKISKGSVKGPFQVR